MLANRYNRAAPSQASYLRPALYHYAPAPACNRKLGKGKSLRALLAARNASPTLTQAWLNANARRLANGQPLIWPSS